MKSRFFAAVKFMTLAFAVVMSFTLTAVSQEVTGSIVGTVRDSAGAVVPGATVTIRDIQKDDVIVRTAVTNSDGEFSAPNLNTSIFSVTVEAANFKKSVSTGIKVDVGQRRIVDVTLAAGSVEEVVNVEANPLQVDLASPQNGTVISGEQVRELSINNRNFTQLVTLAPGVSNDLSDQVYQGTVNPEGQANTVQISVNGARSSQNTFTVDGADITDRGSNLTIQAYPSVDSIGEFRVLRSLYPAESGRSGGGQVNVVTRSGGAKYRGSAFEFIRNEAFNANDFLSNQTAPIGRTPEGKARRRPFRYNNYGFTFGGPVFGWMKNKNKTFFFFSEELRQDKRFPTLTSTVPSGALRQGIFSASICIQASGATCSVVLPAGTPITALATINPIAAQYIQYIYSRLPEPTTLSNFQLISPALNKADFRQEIIKVDHTVNENLSMYYRFQNDKIPTTDVNALFSSGSGLPGVSTTSTNSPGRTHTAQVTYSISPKMIVEGRYTYGYGAILSKNIGTLALSNSPITPPLAYANTRDRVPSVTGNGFSGLTGFGPYDNFSWKQNVTGTFTWIAGSHTMKFGAVYSKYRKNENALAGNNEGLFSGFLTPGGTGNIVAPSGGSATQQQWANFLMGTNVTFTQASYDYTADLRQMAFEAFGQDEYRWKRNVTIYYGVRYSFFGSPWDKNGRLTNFVPSLWDPADAPQVRGDSIRVVGTGNFCNGLIVNSQNTGVTFPNCTPEVSPWGKFVVNAPKTDFAPRVGLAWDPFGDGKTAVRTGYGIYHEQVLNGTALQMIGSNPPYQQTCTVSGVSMANPAAGCSVVASLTVSSLRGIQSDWNTPYMQHWSLDVQRQLTSKALMTVGYYGSKGTHLIGSFEKNLVPPGYALTAQCASGSAYYGQNPAPTLVACQAAGRPFYSGTEEQILDQIRPYRGYRSIAMVEPRFNSNYHSLQMTGQYRLSGSSQINMAYTWGKNLTDSQNDRSSSPMNTYDTSLDYARAALDRRHILTLNFIYEIPWLKNNNSLRGKVFGGWQMSGIVTYNTGLPFTATVSGFDPTGMGIIPPPTTVGRGYVTCNPNAGARHSQAQWFNTACFVLVPNAATTNTSTAMPTAGRNIIEGPPTKRLDLTLSKNIRFSERFRLQLRAEGFNILNTVNFRALSTVIPSVSGAASSTFGRVTSVRDPRVFQFGAKLNF